MEPSDPEFDATRALYTEYPELVATVRLFFAKIFVPSLSACSFRLIKTCLSVVNSRFSALSTLLAVAASNLFPM